MNADLEENRSRRNYVERILELIATGNSILTYCMDLNAEVKSRIEQIQQRIARAAERAGRRPTDVALVAVTKTHPAEAVAAACRAGILDVGENRVQEALSKIEAPGLPETIRWHLIGHLQSNKAKQAVGRFTLIHSLDSIKLADALQKAASDRQFTQPVLIQMNLSEEDTKSGLLTWEDLAGLTEHLARNCPNLLVDGLMTIAAPCDNPEDVRPTFQKLRALRDQIAKQVPQYPWQHLSMGMTGDLEVAVEEGATLVRVGTAIFGSRPYPA